MTQEQFIDAIKIAVTKSSVNGVVSTLKSPPGRNPEELDVKVSKWYNGLDAAEKEIIMHIIKEAVDNSVFGFLCVIDGVRTVTDDGESGEFVLSYKDGEGEYLLNSPNEDYLHDLYNAE